MKKGFTMIELIIVIIVIGILAGMALPQYIKMIERGQVARAKSALDMVRKAEGIYFTNNSRYEDVTAGAWGTSELQKDVNELTSLDSDADWQYGSVTSDNGSKFVATATRLKGVYANCVVNITETGNITDYDAKIRAGGSPSCP